MDTYIFRDVYMISPYLSYLEVEWKFFQAVLLLCSLFFSSYSSRRSPHHLSAPPPDYRPQCSKHGVYPNRMYQENLDRYLRWKKELNVRQEHDHAKKQKHRYSRRISSSYSPKVSKSEMIKREKKV